MYITNVFFWDTNIKFPLYIYILVIRIFICSSLGDVGPDSIIWTVDLFDASIYIKVQVDQVLMAHDQIILS